MGSTIQCVRSTFSDDLANGGFMLFYSCVVNVVLVLWEVGLILTNGYGIQGQTVC